MTEHYILMTFWWWNSDLFWWLKHYWWWHSWWPVSDSTVGDIHWYSMTFGDCYSLTSVLMTILVVVRWLHSLSHWKLHSPVLHLFSTLFIAVQLLMLFVDSTFIVLKVIQWAGWAWAFCCYSDVLEGIVDDDVDDCIDDIRKALFLHWWCRREHSYWCIVRLEG